jgi:formylglycine-generating enzyme required for sulfatase activity
VSWFNARDFCEKHGWRLPTEAEWEYAARAGTKTTWSFGDDEKVLGEYAWFGNSKGEVHPVGTKKPNPWGIYDMHGNAWEWVADWYGDYPARAQVNPIGPETGVLRVLRGAAFFNPPWVLRSADRFRIQPAFRFRTVGFRCARDASPPGPLSHRPPAARERGGG